jgi:hypothetical protein
MVAGPPGGDTSVREKRLCPYARGKQGFVSCNVEECALSLSTQAQDHVWYLAEYKRVEPAHCPLCFMRASLVPGITGVLEFDSLTTLGRTCRTHAHGSNAAQASNWLG